MLTASDNIKKKEVPGLGKATNNVGPEKRSPYMSPLVDEQFAAHTQGL